MTGDLRINRREFCRTASTAIAALDQLVLARMGFSQEAGNDSRTAKLNPAQTFWILTAPQPTAQEELAARELARGLRKLGITSEPQIAQLQSAHPAKQDAVLTIAVEHDRFKHPDACEIAADGDNKHGPEIRVKLSGARPQSTLYAVFDFLQQQGAFFGLDGEVYPLDPGQTLSLPVAGNPWRSQPRFDVRGLVPWPDFLNCITVFNAEDYRAYLEAMLRMRYNTLGIHVYSGGNQWAESFLSFEYGGVGHLAYSDTTATNRWGYLPQRTSRFGMGAAQFYDGEVFGSDATRWARSPWEAAELAQQLWRDAFQYAEKLGIHTGVGFEPYQVPDEILRAVPPEARLDLRQPRGSGPKIDPESVAARDILEARLGQLLEAYPSVDYVWLWEDESMNWASQKSNQPLSGLPFRQAHNFLHRHAPQKRLVLAGWGGVARHFEALHHQLPGDIIFSCLSDTLGWDPVHQVYAKLEGRERWPILWLEDDPAMWLPQFHVHRFQRDMQLAEDFGCQGLLGIHWRHRIVDPTVGFQSRASWEKEIKPAAYYQSYASSLARPGRAGQLAQILDDADRERRLLCTCPVQLNGRSQHQEFASDYDEGFVFWKGYAIPESLIQSQKEVASALQGLVSASSSPAERARLEYLSKHVALLVPYADAWVAASRLHQLIQQAVELKRGGKAQEARAKVEAEGIPLWVTVATKVREVILDFQQIVSTRNDLGTLASMHNKLVRLALVRLPASIKEVLGELPETVRQIQAEAAQPDQSGGSRLIVPARPTILFKGESVRLSAVVPGPEPSAGVNLFTRLSGTKNWIRTPMSCAGRQTYAVQLGPFPDVASMADYYVEVDLSAFKKLTAPFEAPIQTYTLTLA